MTNHTKGRLLFIFFIIGFVLVGSSCKSMKNFGGKYRSHSFSGTTIFYNVQLDFKRDSTFNFDMFLDLMSDHATGRYEVKGRYIYLTYNADTASSSITDLLSSRNKNGRLNYLYRAGNKLFPCDSLGNVFRVGINGAKYYFKKGTF